MSSSEIQCAYYYKTHRHFSGQLLSERNMCIPVSISIDWDSIREHNKQNAIRKSNEKENSKNNSLSILKRRIYNSTKI